MTFTKATLKPLHADIVDALTAVAAKHGLTYRPKGGTYSDATYTVRAEFTTAGVDAANWHRAYALYGFAADDIDKVFSHRAKNYIITSLRNTRGSKPVVVKRLDNGKEYVFTADSVKRALGHPPPQLTETDINGTPVSDAPFKFKVGEKVQSAPDSSDITSMKATWVATIHAIKSANESGGCYETRGEWVPLKDEDGNASDFWSDHDPSAGLTLRQLWASHLVTRE
jgi:hypothetical protein